MAITAANPAASDSVVLYFFILRQLETSLRQAAPKLLDETVNYCKIAIALTMLQSTCHHNE